MTVNGDSVKPQTFTLHTRIGYDQTSLFIITITGNIAVDVEVTQLHLRMGR